MLYGFYWVVAFWKARAISTFDTVKMLIEAYVAGAKLEQEWGLSAC